MPMASVVVSLTIVCCLILRARYCQQSHTPWRGAAYAKLSGSRALQTHPKYVLCTVCFSRHMQGLLCTLW